MTRDVTPDGTMKAVTKEQRRALKGFLPFFSVDTQEEADAVIAKALEVGELRMQADGTIVETTLADEQTLENLTLAGERLAAIHTQLYGGDDGT